MFKEASIILIFVDLVLEQNMKQSKKDVSVNILWNKKLGIWNVECSGEQVSGVSEATAFRGPERERDANQTSTKETNKQSLPLPKSVS